MLQLQLNRTGINSNGTEMYLSDATGDYHVDDNPGGWGAPNPERASKAVLIQAFNNTSEGAVEFEVNEYDPETVDSFVIQCAADGYIETFMIAVDKVEPTVEGAYGWTATAGLVKLEEGVLVDKTVKEVYEDVLFQDSLSYKTVLLARIAIYRNDLNLKLVQKRMQKYDDRGHNREIADLQEQFNFVRSLLEGARYQWCLDSYTEAQRVVEAFNEIIDE